MTSKGAEFSDVQPRSLQGNLDLSFTTINQVSIDPNGLDAGVIQQVTDNNVFRLGQQIFFWLGIANPGVGDGEISNFLTRVRLKPWWARPASEFRQAYGGSGQPSPPSEESAAGLPIDRTVFGTGTQPRAADDNRYVWIPSTKKADTTPFGTAPPPVAPAQHSDSIILDDIWTIDMPSPVGVTSGKFGTGQQMSRWVSILYPAFGYALGFTAETTFENPGGQYVPLSISLQWSIGTFGGAGRFEEPVGG